MRIIDLTSTNKKTDKLQVNLFKANDQKDQALGKPVSIIFHWTAGNYTQVWDDYHFNVAYDTKTNEAVIVKTLDLADKGKHLWGRNTGTIAITGCGMKDAIRPPAQDKKGSFGAFNLQEDQLEKMGLLAAELCAWKQIDPRKTVTVDHKIRTSYSTLSNSGRVINMPTVTDHSMYAAKDGYAADRWDIERYLPIVMNTLLNHYDALKSKEVKFFYEDLIK